MNSCSPSCYEFMQQAYSMTSKVMHGEQIVSADINGAYRFNQGGWKEGEEQRMSDKKQRQEQNWLWIITCCGEAKLTVLGTSYAICVDTPPISRTPAVLFLTSASCRSLPGTWTSTIASPSWQEEVQRGYIMWLPFYWKGVKIYPKD